jgi:hypothetical protein
MKKNITISIAISLLVMTSVSTVFAQTKEQKNIFGIMGGGTASRISDYDGETLFGLTGGLYWEYRFSQKFSLMSNILYSQRGEIGKDNLNGLKLSYINLPIMVKYGLTDNLGISTGINSDMLVSVDAGDLTQDDFKGTDWGIPIGISYNITNHLQVGFIYNIGLSNLLKDSDAKYQSNWANLTIAYMFKKKK